MMMVSSSKQIGRESSNRSTTPQKATGAMKKPGVKYDNYQMAGGNQMATGNKQVLSHQVLTKQGGQVGANFSN